MFDFSHMPQQEAQRGTLTSPERIPNASRSCKRTFELIFIFPLSFRKWESAHPEGLYGHSGWFDAS